MHNRINKLKIKKILNTKKKELSLIYEPNEIQDILDIYNDRIDNYIAENPSASIGDLEAYINNLGDFFKSGLENERIQTIEQHIIKTSCIKKKTRYIVIISILILVTFLIFFIHQIINVQKSSAVYFEEEIHDISESILSDEEIVEYH